MDLLGKIVVFRRVVDAGSISAAAASLDMSSPAVSRSLASLERALGATLVRRTTRQLRVTDAGWRFYHHGARIEAEVARAREAVTTAAAPVGTLVVSAPVSLGLARVGPSMAGLAAAHPALHVELRLEDRAADLIAEGVDIALRAGRRPRSNASLIARQLYRAEQVLVAAPGYLVDRGTPRTPDELERHDVLLHVASAPSTATSRWTFERGTRTHRVSVAGRFRSTTLLALRDAALRGLGIARLPGWMVEQDLGHGGLTRVLAGYRAGAIDVFALYPTALRGDRRVAALLAHLRQVL